LFTAAEDGGLRTWDLAHGKELRRHALKMPQKLEPDWHIEKRPYHLFSADARLLAVGFSSKAGATGANEGKSEWIDANTQWQFDPDSGQRVYAWSLRFPQLGSLALAPDGRTFAGLGRGGTLELFERATGTRRLSLRSGRKDGWWEKAVYRSPLAFSPDGRLLAADGFDDGTVGLYDVATGRLVRALPAGQSGATALVFLDGDVLATAGSDTTILLWDVSADRRRVRLPGVDLSAAELANLWKQLGTDRAHEAIWKLSAGSTSVSFLRKQLRPVAGPAPRQVEQWLKDLNDDRYDVREKATRQLRDLGELAEPALRAYLSKKPPLEPSRRAARLLQALENRQGVLTPEQLRSLRGLEVLETIGTDRARRLLAELAGGAAGAWLTREAQSTLDRLPNRSRRHFSRYR
jgi:WD40 repeat protein